MLLIRLLNTWLWPALAGCAIAVSVLLYTGQILNKIPEPTAITSTATTFAPAVNKAVASVVNIYTSKTIKRRQLLIEDPILRRMYSLDRGSMESRVQNSLGSGVIVGSDGLILTNQHVIEGADEALVMLSDGATYPAALIGIDSEMDLAVLKISANDLVAATIADPSQAHVGDIVLAIGNPFHLGHTVTQGIISGLRHRQEGEIMKDYIQTDAAINPGNSGGALVDVHGNLLGINRAMLDVGGNSVGIGFAIPSTAAMDVMQKILSSGWLGIEAQSVDESTAHVIGLLPNQCLMVSSVYPNEPAAKAGILPNDIITHINGIAIDTSSPDNAPNIAPGNKVSLRIIRRGQPVDVTLITAYRGIHPIEH